MDNFGTNIAKELVILQEDGQAQLKQLHSLEKLTTSMMDRIMSLSVVLKSEITKKDRIISDLKSEVEVLRDRGTLKRKANEEHGEDEHKRMRVDDSSGNKRDYNEKRDFDNRRRDSRESHRVENRSRDTRGTNRHHRDQSPHNGCKENLRIKDSDSKEHRDNQRTREDEKTAKPEVHNKVVTESYGGIDVPTSREHQRKVNKVHSRTATLHNASKSENDLKNRIPRKKLKVVVEMEKHIEEKRSNKERRSFCKSRSSLDNSHNNIKSESHTKSLLCESRQAKAEMESDRSKGKDISRNASFEEGEIVSDDEVTSKGYRHGKTFEDTKRMRRSRSKSCYEIRHNDEEHASHVPEQQSSDTNSLIQEKWDSTKTITLHEYRLRLGEKYRSKEEERSKSNSNNDKHTEDKKKSYQTRSNKVEQDLEEIFGTEVDMAEDESPKIAEVVNEVCRKSDDMCSNTDRKIEQNAAAYIFGAPENEKKNEITDQNKCVEDEKNEIIKKSTEDEKKNEITDQKQSADMVCPAKSKETKIVVLSDIELTPRKVKVHCKRQIDQNPLTVLADTAIEQSEKECGDRSELEKTKLTDPCLGHREEMPEHRVINKPIEESKTEVTDQNLDTEDQKKEKPEGRWANKPIEGRKNELTCQELGRKSQREENPEHKVVNVSTEERKNQLTYQDLGTKEQTEENIDHDVIDVSMEESEVKSEEKPLRRSTRTRKEVQRLDASVERTTNRRRNSKDDPRDKIEAAEPTRTVPAGYSTPTSERTTTEVKEKRRITPIPVKDKPECSFRHFLEKTTSSTFTVQSTFHLTHDGEIPVLHLEDNLSNLNGDSRAADNTIMNLLDTMDISTTEGESMKVKPANVDGLFENLINKVETVSTGAGRNCQQVAQKKIEGGMSTATADLTDGRREIIPSNAILSENITPPGNDRLSFENCLNQATSTPITTRQSVTEKESGVQRPNNDFSTNNSKIVSGTNDMMKPEDNVTPPKVTSDKITSTPLEVDSKETQSQKEVNIDINNVSRISADAPDQSQSDTSKVIHTVTQSVNVSTGQSSNAPRRRRRLRIWGVAEVD